MKKQYLLLLAFNLLLVQGYTQRRLEFFNLESPGNKPFFRKQFELSYLITSGINESEIDVELFNDDFSKSNQITKEESKERIIMFVDSTDRWFRVEYHYPKDYSILALDYIDNNPTYIHIYLNNEFGRRYVFSVPFNQVVSYLKNKERLVPYYTTNELDFWRGYMIISGDRYYCDTQIYPSLMNKSELKNNVFDHSLFESKTSNGYVIDSLRINYMDAVSWLYNGKSKLFSWESIQSESKKFRGKVLPLWLAVYQHKFAIDSSIIIPSKLKSKFKKTRFDEKWDEKKYLYSTIQLERLFFDEKNQSFHRPKQISLSDLLFEYVFKNKVTLYRNDSLKTSFQMDEKSKINNYWPNDFHKRENDSVYVGDTITIEEATYVIKKNVSLNNQNEWGNHYQRWYVDSTIHEVIPNRYWAKEDFRFIELIWSRTSDYNGESIEYKLLGINLFIDATRNHRGIDIPIASVKWEDVKHNLLKDYRAEVSVDGLRTNYSKLLENRNYISNVIKNDHIYIID